MISSPLVEQANPRITVRRIASRPQRTLAATVTISGVGFITGSAVRMRMIPAPIDTGILFQRTDVRTAIAIPARSESVTGTERRTTLGSGSNQVTLVEHVLSALAGLRIDNCIVELNAPEPPGLDGSSKGFVEAIHSAGVVLQRAQRGIWSAIAPLRVSQNGATMMIYPATDSRLTMTYRLDYGPRSPIPPQARTEMIDPGNYAREIAISRTFVLQSEALALLERGIGQHLTPKELIVFGANGPMDNQLRFADEPARHKILDMVGDLALCGFDLAGHIVAYRSGHPLNVEMARLLVETAGNAVSTWSFRRAA